MGVDFIEKTVIRNECLFITLICQCFADVVPSTTNEISDDDCYNNESEYLIPIHHHVLSCNLFISRLILAAHD